MNKEIMRILGFGAEVKDIEQGHCPICKSPIDTTTFQDAISLREFQISGMCQNCQDKSFNGN